MSKARRPSGQWAAALAAGSAGPLLRLALAFAKTGLFTFGSGYAMLSLMQREIVDRHGWLTAEQFADVVAIAEVTPGPITVNMATSSATGSRGSRERWPRRWA